MKRFLLLWFLLLSTSALALDVDGQKLDPSNVLCSSSGATGNWDETMCAGTYSSNPSSCSDARIWCDDTNFESFTNSRDNVMGVDAIGSDIDVDPAAGCDAITEVLVEYRYSTLNAPSTQVFEVSNDNGTGWSGACGGAPGTEGVTNTCNVTASYSWTCNDFFGSSPDARTRIYISNSGGSPNTDYSITVNYLVFNVSYNYTVDALNTDKLVYEQSENATIIGSDIWGSSTTVNFTVSNDQGVVDTFDAVTESDGTFTTSYLIGDYAQTTNYTILAVQENDPSINATTSYNVTQRSPMASADKQGGYYNRSQTINITGSSWATSANVDVEVYYNDTLQEQTTTASDSQGGLSYQYVLDDSFRLNNTPISFVFTEQANSSYNQTVDTEVVVLADAANRSTDGADVLSGTLEAEGDTALFVSDNSGEQYFSVSFYPTTINGADILDFDLTFRHREESGAAGAFVKYFNTTSGLWETVCSYPARTSLTYDTCDFSSIITDSSAANTFDVRISDDDQTGGGGSSYNYEIDLIYLTAQYLYEPGIENITESDVGIDSATVSWDTQNPSNSTIYYGTAPSVTSSLSNSTLSNSHSFTLTGLDDDTQYYYRVYSCTEISCELSALDSFTTLENLAPQIREVSINDLTNDSATIQWYLTIEGNATLEYGVSSVSENTLSDSSSATEHSFSIGGLQEATTYRFQITSCNELGCATRTDTFRTGTPPDACVYYYSQGGADPGMIGPDDIVVVECPLNPRLHEKQELQVSMLFADLRVSREITAPSLLFTDVVVYP